MWRPKRLDRFRLNLNHLLRQSTQRLYGPTRPEYNGIRTTGHGRGPVSEYSSLRGGTLNDFDAVSAVGSTVILKFALHVSQEVLGRTHRLLSFEAARTT
jgi:hypothetical protein